MLFACSSDDANGTGSGVPLPPDYVPSEAAAQNPLPPGAGPRDGGIVPMDTAPPRDTGSPMDVSVPETAPVDAGSTDGTVG